MMPISVTLDEIKKELGNFVENHLPLELLTTQECSPKEEKDVKDLLGTDVRTVRLVGLLSHYLYWKLFTDLYHGSARKLPESSLGALHLAINEIWSSVETDFKE